MQPDGSDPRYDAATTNQITRTHQANFGWTAITQRKYATSHLLYFPTNSNVSAALSKSNKQKGKKATVNAYFSCSSHLFGWEIVGIPPGGKFEMPMFRLKKKNPGVAMDFLALASLI